MISSPMQVVKGLILSHVDPIGITRTFPIHDPSHSTSLASVTVGFFYDPFTQLSRHLLHITAIER